MILNQVQFAPQAVFANEWRHFWLLQLGGWGEGTLLASSGQRPEMLLNNAQRSCHNNRPAQNVNSATAEKPWFSLMMGQSLFTTLDLYNHVALSITVISNMFELLQAVEHASNQNHRCGAGPRPISGKPISKEQSRPFHAQRYPGDLLKGPGLFSFNFIYLFIYLWLCCVFVSVWGLSQVVASGDHPSSRCAGLSLSRPLLFRSTGSRRASSVIVAHGPSCSAACGIFPDQGSNPCPLHWQADSQPLRKAQVLSNELYFQRAAYQVLNLNSQTRLS